MGDSLAVVLSRAAMVRQKAVSGLTAPSAGSGGWWPLVREAHAGDWQRNLEWNVQDVLTYAPVWACATLIASDIAKLRIGLTQETDRGIWAETDDTDKSPFLRVLEKPNGWQTRIQFIDQWLLSKTLHGNTYAIKARDQRGMVAELHILDPQRVTPLVAPNGSVYYQVGGDDLAGVPNGVAAAPASEIIHDRMNPLYHPLCGVSPIRACAVAAIQGLRIQTNSARFFGNNAQPGGILTAPGMISKETQQRLEQHWNTNYGGENVGKIAVVGDGLKFEPLAFNAQDAQLIEQLKWTAHDVCTAFHVPPYMIGVGPPPTYNNIEALNAQYYAQCLQNLIESIEVLLDEGLSLPSNYATEFDIDALLRMDQATRMTVAKEAMSAGMAPNEVRKKFHGLGPVDGGDKPFLQEQNWPIDLLSAREIPTRPPTPPSDAAPAPNTTDKAKVFNVRARAEMRARKALAA